jgi:hypothetical protein
MAENTRQVDVYWAVRDGERFTLALSESEARDSLENYWVYEENPLGWSIERTSETVPVVTGKPFMAERTVLAALTGEELAKDIPAPHVAWDCPHCGCRHTTDLCNDMECQDPPLTSPQLWTCDRNLLNLVWVEW